MSDEKTWLTPRTFEELHQLINRLKDQLAEAEGELQKRESKRRAPWHVLAEALHDNFCRCSHTDQCGWCYETGPDKWELGDHKRWLDRTEAWLKLWPNLSLEHALTAVELVADFVNPHTVDPNKVRLTMEERCKQHS